MQTAARYWDVPIETIDGTVQLFWTGDIVEIINGTITETWDHKPLTTHEVVILRGDSRLHDRQWLYWIKLPDDPSNIGRPPVKEENLKLIRRGNLWNYHHDLPLAFESVTEEGQFFFNLGHVTTVEASGWTDFSYLPNLMKAMKKGRVDTFVRTGHFNHAYKYDDPEVGRRVREFTLEQFKDWREKIPRNQW